MGDLPGRRGVVAVQDEALLCHLLSLLGLVAAVDEASLQFLLKGCDNAFWDAHAGWEVDGGRIGNWAINGDCVRGLVPSGRPEAQEFIAQLRDDPERAMELGVDSAMVDAAWIADTIQERGLQSALDDVI